MSLIKHSNPVFVLVPNRQRSQTDMPRPPQCLYPAVLGLWQRARMALQTVYSGALVGTVKTWSSRPLNIFLTALSRRRQPHDLVAPERSPLSIDNVVAPQSHRHTYLRRCFPPLGLIQFGPRLTTVSRVNRSPGFIIMAMSLPLVLSGCQTTSTTVTTREGRCAAWRAITYSAKGDTKLTVDQIRTHNLVGKKLGCWK